MRRVSLSIRYPRGIRLVRSLAWSFVGALLLSSCGLDSFQTVTDHGDSIRTLNVALMILSGLVILLVWVVLAIILTRFRPKPGEEGEPRQIHGNRKLEITWTGIPVALLAVIFVFTLTTMLHVDASPAGAMRVDVIAHDWWWEYHYPGQNVTTANDLHLPVGVPIELHVTTGDVIHDFWVPRLGWKTDAIPGQDNVLRFTLTQAGQFDGACSEYCGTEHAWMLIHLTAQPKSDFDSWVTGQQQTPPAPTDPVAQRGQQIFLSNTCVNCHTIRGTAANARVGPELTYVGQRPLIGSGVLPNTPANLKRFVGDVQQVKPGVHMPSYNFSDDDLNALVTYLEGLK